MAEDNPSDDPSPLTRRAVMVKRRLPSDLLQHLSTVRDRRGPGRCP